MGHKPHASRRAAPLILPDGSLRRSSAAAPTEGSLKNVDTWNPRGVAPRGALAHHPPRCHTASHTRYRRKRRPRRGTWHEEDRRAGRQAEAHAALYEQRTEILVDRASPQRPAERPPAEPAARQAPHRLHSPLFADPNLAPKPRTENPSTVAAALRTVDPALHALTSSLGLSAAAARIASNPSPGNDGRIRLHMLLAHDWPTRPHQLPASGPARGYSRTNQEAPSRALVRPLRPFDRRCGLLHH